MKKIIYTAEEIDDFKKFLRITRRIPHESLLKLLDKWRKECARKDDLLRLCLACALVTDGMSDLVNELKKEVLK